MARKEGEMNPPADLIADIWANGGQWLIRDDPATESFKTGGVYRYTDGTTYRGQFKNGMRHGLGTQITTRGDCYTGNFAFDQKSGTGRELLA